jgi:hypothetical protein
MRIDSMTALAFQAAFTTRLTLSHISAALVNFLTLASAARADQGRIQMFPLRRQFKMHLKLAVKRMKTNLLGGIGIACMALLGISSSAATTYNVTETGNAGFTLSGTITTTNTIGVLDEGNILTWDLKISASFFGNTPAILDNGNSAIVLAGNDLIGTGTKLEFDFADTTSGASAGEFEIHQPPPVGVCFPCNNVYFFSLGAPVDPGLFLLLGGFSAEAQYQDGKRYADLETIGTAATPLPAALPLFATGLGAMGLFGWRRKRKAAASLAAA